MSAQRPRVLLADDHHGVIKALVGVLEDDCDVVGVISDGSDVVSEAARLEPVVSIVDVNMPNVNGLDICRQLKQANRDARVIVISGMLDDSVIEEALAAGAVDCIHKARAASQLVRAVKHAWDGA